jgi:uroporphyrinogen-III synthase
MIAIDTLLPRAFGFFSSSPNCPKGAFEYVVVTSPEAAAVLLQGWREAGQPTLRYVASIGKSTSDALRLGGVEVAFEPTKATAGTLAAELPDSLAASSSGQGCRVLYPASVKAATTLQDGLAARGFRVARLDTYSTEPSYWKGRLRSV